MDERKESKHSIVRVLKKFSLWFFTIAFLETAFIFIMKSVVDLESILNIFVFSVILSSFLTIISNVFKSKINVVITAIILFLLGTLFSIQCVFYNVFKVYFSLNNLGLSDQLGSFLGETFMAIFENLIYIIIFMLPFILFLIFHKKLDLKRNHWFDYLCLLILLVVFIPFFYLNIWVTKGKTNGAYDLYYNVDEIYLNINKFGVLNSYTIDLKRLLFGFVPENLNYVNVDGLNNNTEDPNGNVEDPIEEPIVYEPNVLDLNLDKETSSSSIQKINLYVANDSPTMKNEYTGMFEGYNLVYITAESFSQIGVSEELTPTLYKLTHTGFVFDNYYTPNALSTIGGEFQSLTGLYPDSAILKRWRSGSNYFPYGLATVFGNLGYNTYAYHNNSYAFQDRHVYLKSQGFTNFLACYNGLEKKINCKRWPQSDDDMMEVTIPDWINSEQPFLAYYMTVSGHYAYTFSDNSMAKKHKEEVSHLNLSEMARGYVATQIELDKALERLLDELEKAGKLDNTVIVLLADHYPYKLDLNSINSLSDYERDEIVEVNHNSLILWNSKMAETHIEKPCMSSDVIPTVFNLFGIEYDSRLFTGRDILSDSFGIAIMRNHSWVTDQGTYFAATKKFVPREGKEEVDEEYINNINTLVNNRLNIAKLILETDYYRYLFK